MKKTTETILVVDDDDIFCHVMQRALLRQGYEVVICQNSTAAEKAAKEIGFEKAIVDLKIAQESGLSLIKNLKALQPNLAIVMLTGYASVSTAVEAIKLGALHYLCKPADIHEILNAFNENTATEDMHLPAAPPSLGRLEWEHIQKVLRNNDDNVSAAARELGMHRRTLQRKLLKRPSGY
jgi:two-component system, response regulator RegA